MKISGKDCSQPFESPLTHNLVFPSHPPMASGLTCCSPGRLVEDEERRWTDENIDMVALKHFPNIDKERAMSRPILYSNWLSKVTRPCSQPCPSSVTPDPSSVTPDLSSVTWPCSQPCSRLLSVSHALSSAFLSARMIL